jgi:uncharacterized protein YraI
MDMKMKRRIAAGALLAALAVPGAAAAEQAYVMIDLNLRAGPGPQFPVVAVIPGEQGVTIHGCTASLSWCDVTWGNERGWAYAQYLASDTAGQTVIVSGGQVAPPTVEYQTTTYWDQHYSDRPFYSERERYVVSGGGSTGAAAGVAGGVIAGAVLGGPIGAAIGGVAGAAIGAAIDPPQRVSTYVVEQPAEQVLLEGEIVVGARLPELVTLQPVPDYDYHYAVVNGQRVLVDPQTRVIVYIYR